MPTHKSTHTHTALEACPFPILMCCSGSSSLLFAHEISGCMLHWSQWWVILGSSGQCFPPGSHSIFAPIVTIKRLYSMKVLPHEDFYFDHFSFHGNSTLPGIYNHCLSCNGNTGFEWSICSCYNDIVHSWCVVKHRAGVFINNILIF